MNVLRPEEDWQSRRTVIECNRYMWANQVACDVTFLVGDQMTRIGAHKYVLASRSCTFYQMFYGPLSGNTGTEIVIPDMTTEQFNDLMQFLYTEYAEVNLDNVLPTLYGAEKFAVQGLVDKCLNLLKQYMVPENICTVMENAHLFGDHELMRKCFDLILTASGTVLKAEDLSKICQECLASIIKDDNLAVKEEEIFEAVLRFAKEKCDRLTLVQTPENLREMVKDVLPHIRFPLMSTEFVCETVEPSRLLSDEQSKTLLKYMLLKRPVEAMIFSAKKRKMVFTAQRFTQVTSGWGYKRDKCDAVTFATSSDIVLKGLQIYGSCQGAAELDVMIHVKQGDYNANLVIQHTVLETDGKQKVYNIFFENPPTIKKKKKYTITLVIKGPSTYYGEKGIKELQVNDVLITFEKSCLSTNTTNEERGQIPSIIYAIPEAQGAEAVEVQT